MRRADARYYKAFGENFSRLYDEWAKKKASNGEKPKLALFAYEVETEYVNNEGMGTNHAEGNPSLQVVSEWKNGKSLPEKYLPAVCRVFGCNEEMLIPHLSPWSSVLGDFFKHFVNEYGVIPEFLNLILSDPELTTVFPFQDAFFEQYPLLNGIEEKHNKPFLEDDSFLFFKTNEGKERKLTVHDLQVIKELQDETLSFIVKFLKDKKEEQELEYCERIKNIEKSSGRKAKTMTLPVESTFDLDHIYRTAEALQSAYMKGVKKEEITYTEASITLLKDTYDINPKDIDYYLYSSGTGRRKKYKCRTTPNPEVKLIDSESEEVNLIE